MSSTDMSGTEWSAQTRRDGAALALLLVALFAAETFDTARAEIQALAGSDPPAARLATPSWLWVVWSGLVVAGAFVGGYVARRFVAIARELDESSDRGLVRTVRRFMPAFAVAAVVVWLGWQVAGILVVADVYAAPNLLIWSLRALAALLAGAAVCLGGAVLGDATVAIERGPLVRLQLVFLLVLFILVFRASFVSDQLTDVLRGWGDGPMSRPLAGIAAALLLGAVLRASASRLLLPRTSADPSGLYKPAQALAATMRDSRDRHVRRLAAWHLLAGLGILLFAVGLRTLGLAFPAPRGWRGSQRRPYRRRSPRRRSAAGCGGSRAPSASPRSGYWLSA
jgi:hypothetical protein